MKLSNMILLASPALLSMASPIAEPIPVALADASASKLDARTTFTIKVGGGANFNPVQFVQVNDATTPNVANPFQTFGSFDTMGVNCHCYTGGGSNTFSQPFSGTLLDVKNTWGDFWFFNCKFIACWN